MQFYILHPDPTTSSHLLPNYALRHVNLREGWQMISDIGHMTNVTWPGQNKPYSLSHAKTRTFATDEPRWSRFVNHYEANLYEYYKRFGKLSPWQDKFNTFVNDGYERQVAFRLPALSSRYEDDIRYLLSQKRSHLSEDEIEQLARQLPPDHQREGETT